MNSSRVAECWSYIVKRVFKPHGLTESWVTFVLWIISISIDPLLFYLPVINNDKKSVEINNILAVLLFVLLLFLQFCGFTTKHAFTLTTSAFMLQCLFVNTMMKSSAAVYAIAVNSFLAMSSWRVYGIYGLFTYKITRALADEEVKTIIIKIVLNFVLYLYGGYVFGGIWYLMAIRKKTECWINACRNHSGCHLDATFGFIVTSSHLNVNSGLIVSSGNLTFLDDNCPKILRTEDTEKYKLGMFKDAFEFGIVESKNIPWKLLLCFRWGLQNLSGIGQNLPSSAHAAENIFVIFIIIYGVVKFTYFLGNVQMYIQHTTNVSWKRRRQEEEKELRTKQVQALQKWVPFEKLSTNLRNEIIEKQNYKKVQIVNLRNLLSNVPEDVGYRIKQELCWDVIKEIQMFGSWRAASLDSLYKCVKPVILDPKTIVRIEDPVYRMWFLVQGNVLADTDTGSVDNLKFWGEELFEWAADQTDSSLPDSVAQTESNMPRSKRTIRAKEDKKIEAFVLTARNFKQLYDDESRHVRQSITSDHDRATSRNAEASTQEPAPHEELHTIEIVEEK